MNKLDDNVFLFEDYWIRQRLSEIVKSDKILTQSECKKYVNKMIKDMQKKEMML